MHGCAVSSFLPVYPCLTKPARARPHKLCCTFQGIHGIGIKILKAAAAPDRCCSSGKQVIQPSSSSDGLATALSRAAGSLHSSWGSANVHYGW